LLNLDSLGDDLLDQLALRLVLEVRVEQASKVGVHSLVTGDELVGEGKTWHQATLLEPEDGSKRTGEEDTLDGGKCDQTAGKRRVLVGYPAESPVGLLLDARD